MEMAGRKEVELPFLCDNCGDLLCILEKNYLGINAWCRSCGGTKLVARKALNINFSVGYNGLCAGRHQYIKTKSGKYLTCGICGKTKKLPKLYGEKYLPEVRTCLSLK